MNEDFSQNRLGYIIGVIIFLFLSVFLILYYFSLNYYALFSLQEEIPNLPIISLKTLKLALEKGILSFLVCLSGAMVFLSSGFLLHIYRAKPIVFSITFILVFLYDVVISFEITKRRTLAKREDLDSVNFGETLQSEEFYIILMLGFVGYVMWGIIFNHIYSLTQKSKFKQLQKTELQLDKIPTEFESFVKIKEANNQNHLIEVVEYLNQSIKDLIFENSVIKKELVLLKEEFNKLDKNNSSKFENISKIISLVKADKISQAIELLHDLGIDSKLDSVVNFSILQKANLSRIEKNVQMGLQGYSELSVVKSRIINSILNVIKEIENTTTNKVQNGK